MVAKARKFRVDASYSCFHGHEYYENLDTPPDYRGICLLVDNKRLWFSPKDLKEITLVST